MQMRFEGLAAVSVRIWFPGMLYHMVLYIGTKILEEPATFIFRVDRCVTHYPDDGGSRFFPKR
jgi:hypothetical protein